MAIEPPPTGTSREPAVLGIDLGTSSVKAVVIDLRDGLAGAVLGQAAAEYPVSGPHPGWSETDPRAWLDATTVAVRTAVAAAGVAPAAIGLSGQMHGVVPTDAAGAPVRPAMLWSDSRAVTYLAVYRDLGAPVRRRLANPLSPGMAGPMLAWLAAEEPSSAAAMRWALQPKDWLRAQLTGSFHSEPSDASATLLYDVAADRWDDEVIAALGLDRDALPPLLPASACPAGLLTDDAARRLGLPAGIPVAAGAADTAAAALGSGLVAPGTAQLTVGTGAQLVKPVAALPDPLPTRPVTHLYRAATDAGWYAMGAILNGGLTLEWVRRVLGTTWQQLYEAAATEPRADDPFFLPHLHGERTPYLDPSLRAAWTDLAPHHGQRELLRAALEGVAFAIRDALDQVLSPEDGVSHLRLAGGGSTHPAWRQMLADTLGYGLAAVDVPAASGRGAALLGARAAGLADEATGLASRIPEPLLVAEPRAGAGRLCQDRHHAFRQRVPALRAAQAGRPGAPDVDDQ
jgi:xylulokinase